jgi:hypothetical protein
MTKFLQFIGIDKKDIKSEHYIYLINFHREGRILTHTDIINLKALCI